MKLTALLLVPVVAASAQRPIRPGEDWVALFNGKDLTGWVEVGKEKWVVADGVIHGEAVTKAYGYLKTDKNYKDFHLSIRFKCEGDGNSGLFFHADFKPGTPDVSQGLQFEIDCTINRHTAGIYGDGRNWIVWPSPENEGVVRQNDWNDMQVRVEGNRYVSRLNGVLMVDYTDPSPRSHDGAIALQLHSGGRGNMKFKDIYIRDLSKR
ncbi:MAG: 3-keto-disaccharide hydrolase [Bryobacteraceae bacterium]